jgi:hypothetical protein
VSSLTHVFGTKGAVRLSMRDGTDEKYGSPVRVQRLEVLLVVASDDHVVDLDHHVSYWSSCIANLKRERGTIDMKQTARCVDQQRGPTVTPVTPRVTVEANMHATLVRL